MDRFGALRVLYCGIGLFIASGLALAASTSMAMLLGAAFLAGLGTNLWPNQDALRDTWALDRSFSPKQSREKADAAHALWRKAVERAKSWA